MIDFVASNQGSITLVIPVSDAAKNWVSENVSIESWQWLGHAFGVDHRYAGNLIEGIQADGLDVAEA